MDKFIGIELDHYGFLIDSKWFYLSISYELIGLVIALVIARRYFLNRKRKRVR